MGPVLIAYRRDDTASWASRIQRWMEAGHAAVWHLDLADVAGEGTGPGTLGRVTALGAVVALIGPRFLDGGGPDRELVDVLAAAMRHGIDLVPVLVDGAPMPADEMLPAEIRNLVAYPALHMGGATFEADLARLAGRVLPPERPEAAAAPQATARARMALVIAALLVLLGMAIAVFAAGSTETGGLGPLFI